MSRTKFKSTKGKRRQRMTAAERRQSILLAASPLMAQAGLQGASTREIAEAAGISEALLYKHFPSKQALFDEALATVRERSRFTISRFATFEPSTKSFVLLAYATVDFILFGFPGLRNQEPSTSRLIFQSLLGDGTHARTVMADAAGVWMDYVVTAYAAAVEAGDVVELAIDPAHRFRFVQQLAMALRLSHLPEPPAFAYRGTLRSLTDEAVLFSLRGVGLADAAIKKYFRPQQLQAALTRLFPDEASRSGNTAP